MSETTTGFPSQSAWFTFGQNHIHRIAGQTFDCDTVVKITTSTNPNDRTPREVMFDTFGNKWSMEYDSEPNMKYFREILELKGYETI